MKIINAIHRLPFDRVFVDLGAGSTYNVLDFFLSAHEGIFVFTPEPISIQNTVQFIKAVYLRRVKQILKRYAFTNVSRNWPKNRKRVWSDPLWILLTGS
jgi:flagellar biosynthesis protein FlhG